MANPTTGFRQEAKRLTHPRTTLQQFIEKYDLEAEIISFAVNREFPSRPGNHYVIHIGNGKGNATGVWMTDNQAPTLERCLLALRRECRWVISAVDKAGRDRLEDHLVFLGLCTTIEDTYEVAQSMRDNVAGFRWAFGSEAMYELVSEVIA